MGDGTVSSPGTMEINFQLENDMRQFTQDLQKWASHQVSQASSTRARHQDLLRQHKEQLATLTLQQQSLQDAASSQNQSNSIQSQQIAKLQTEIARLQEELSALPAVAQSATDGLRLAKSQTELQQQEADVAVAEQTKRLRSLQQKVDLFQQRLGLSLQKVDGGLQVCYTLVDSKNPERVFSFVVRITPENKYEIKNVSPTLNATEVEGLVNQLNAQNNFSWFVQTMRQKFRTLV